MNKYRNGLFMKKITRRVVMLCLALVIFLPMCIETAHAQEKNVEVGYSSSYSIVEMQVEGLLDEIVLANATVVDNKIDVRTFVRQYRVEITSIMVFLLISFLLIYLRLVKDNEKKLKNIVEVDYITGLMTVRKLIQDIKVILKTAAPNEYYLISFDVDNFKLINQTYGVEKGNALLSAVADSMKKYADKDSLLCRYHNDIFLVFGKAREISEFNADEPMFSQERCDEIMEAAGIKSTLHFSTGVYYIESPNSTVDYVSDCVRQARMISKQKHGNIVTIYTEKIRAEKAKETLIYNSMEQAAKDEEFFVVIQPKIELQTGRLVGGEVLARWKKADGTFIGPDEFIPLFEKTHFIITLDKYVFEKTCEFVQNSKIPLLCISVNVSSVTALDENFVKDYLDILNSYGLVPQQFELELTETVFSHDIGPIVDVMREVKELGFVLSIDDFGKGASSLSRIKELEVDSIKLDRGFITNNFEIEKGNVVIANTIALANSLGFVTLAEGIETQEQLDLLIELGCDFGQGYLFDKPLSFEDFRERVEADAKKDYPIVIKSDEKIKGYLMNFEFLPYGIAVTKNDTYSTVIKANDMFYNIIGHTKQSFLEEHENRLINILIDDGYDAVNRQAANEDYTEELDLRVRKSNGEIAWVHDYSHYNAEQDLFFLTFVDTSDKMFLSKMELSIEAYQAQKASLIYLNEYTSEYVVISDLETDRIVYMNENAMRLCNFTKESDWRDKRYCDVMFGSAEEVDESYYKPLTEEFSNREYYNKFFNMHFHVENKIIMVMGKKKRLNITTDVSAKKKVEYEFTLQTTLKQCVEHLYTSTTIDPVTAFRNMLEQLRLYYNADRAYFYKLTKDGVEREMSFEVLESDVKSAEGSFQEMPEYVKSALLGLLDKSEAVYQNHIGELIGCDKGKLLSAYSKYNVTSFTYGAVKDTEGKMIGFMGVDNPKKDGENTELMVLLSRFIWMFIKNISSRQLEKENIRLEELSKIKVLEKCTENLKTLIPQDENITDILHSLREHYGASYSGVLIVAEDRVNYNILYEDSASDMRLNIVELKKRSTSIISKWIKCFEQNIQLAVASVEELELSAEDIEMWTEYGIVNSMAAPMYDKGGVLVGLLIINNPTIVSRSRALLHVVAKDISDYLEKSAIQMISELDELTGVNQKITTQKKIVSLLERGCEGVMYMIDIDNFKTCNDTLGHSVGDKVLSDLGAELKRIFRGSDIIGRIGGDEFMIFCPNLVSEEIVKKKAQTILKEFDRVYEKSGSSVQVSVSIGICRVDENCDSFMDLYERTDEALYKAKRNGRNQYSILE